MIVIGRGKHGRVRQRLLIRLAVGLLGIGCAPSIPPPPSGMPLGYELLEETGLTPLGFEAAPTDLDPAEVDVVYCYPWPGEASCVEQVFDLCSTRGAVLLTFHDNGFQLHRKTA